MKFPWLICVDKLDSFGCHFLVENRCMDKVCHTKHCLSSDTLHAQGNSAAPEEQAETVGVLSLWAPHSTGSSKISHKLVSIEEDRMSSDGDKRMGSAELPRSLSNIHSIEDLRRAAKKVLPRMVFDFVEGGSQTESTIRENRKALDCLRLVPSAPAAMSTWSPAVQLFGKPAAMPIVIGPTGMADAFWPRGDQALAQAASDHGIPFVMSTNATSSLEDVARSSNGQKWFQLYMGRDRVKTAQLLQRLKENGFDVIEVTVDTIVPSRRLRDEHNGFGPSLRWTPSRLLDVLSAPGWLWRRLPHGTPKLILLEELYGSHGDDKTPLSEIVRQHANPGISWEDLAWLRDQWRGPLVMKGVCDPLQAQRAADLGLDGIVVSNHGGRQLDEAVSSIDALIEIVATCGSRLDVLVDSGFYTGADILKALAVGAKAVQIGRATLYGLSVAGREGVDHALRILRAELNIAQALCGVADLSTISTASLRDSRAARSLTRKV